MFCTVLQYPLVAPPDRAIGRIVVTGVVSVGLLDAAATVGQNQNPAVGFAYFGHACWVPERCLGVWVAVSWFVEDGLRNTFGIGVGTQMKLNAGYCKKQIFSKTARFGERI